MNKAEKKFRLYAVAAVSVLLTVLLGVINIVNFTMAAQDADMITQMLAEQKGMFGQDDFSPGQDSPPGQFKPWEPGRFGAMGPGSPDVRSSVRYFTFAFSEEDDTVKTVEFRMSAVSEDGAREWARGLLNEKTGWTNGTYRYRVYKDKENKLTYVTVTDQGRELLPCYRILLISVTGGMICILISFIFLKLAGRAVFSPLAEADRKQKGFISGVNKEFGLPLTVINANTELLERKHGSDENTSSIRRQVGKLETLVKKISAVSIFENDGNKYAPVNISDMLRASLDLNAERFAACGIEADTDIAQGITVNADPEAMKRVMDELISNVIRFSGSRAVFSLRRDGERIILRTENDTALPDGEYDQVFDRFTKLENAADTDTAGLGLSYVKEVITAHGGRVSAFSEKGSFILRAAL